MEVRFILAQSNPGAVGFSPQRALRQKVAPWEMKLRFMLAESNPGAVGFSLQLAGGRISYLAAKKLNFANDSQSFPSEALSVIRSSDTASWQKWLVEQIGLGSLLRVIPARRNLAQSFELDIFMARGVGFAFLKYI